MRKLAIFSIVVAACSDTSLETRQDAIHKGTEDGSLTKHVLLVQTHSEGLCSSAAIHYPRCIVTAAHCKNFDKVYGGNVRPLVDGKTQKKELREKHPGSGGLFRGFAHDLQIAWLKNLTPGKEDRLQVSDYEPREPIAVGKTFQGLGIEPTTGFPQNDPMKYFDATIAGYGGVSDDAPQPFDLAVLRTGVVSITTFYGFAFRSRAKASEQEICGGDSGGPLLSNGAILGIHSGSDLTTCDGTGFSYHTAFGTEKVDGERPNYDWTMDTIEELCTKWQSVKIDGQGSVDGSILPTQARPVGGLRGNDTIHCPPGGGKKTDCEENFHAKTAGRNEQTMTMVATPSQGWTFSHWSSESKVKKCQCVNAGASCTVAEGPMGYYDPDTSIDEDVCIAHFVKDSDGGGGDGGGSDSGYDSGGGGGGGGGDPDGGAPEGGDPDASDADDASSDSD